MRFRWRHREAQGRKDAQAARAEYEKALEQTQRIERIAEENRRIVQANGWTEAIIKIIDGHTA